MDYNGLIQGVSDWLNRDDLGSQIPGFIALFEARFNRLVRASEVSAQWTATGGVFTLPGDFKRMRKASIDGSPISQVTQVSPDEAVRLYGGITGTPSVFTIEAGVLNLYPAGDAVLDVTYFSKLPALSVSNPTNWLLDDSSDVYLSGALFYAANYIDDADQAAKFGAYADQGIAEINTALRNDKWGTPLAPRGPAQVSGGRC